MLKNMHRCIAYISHANSFISLVYEICQGCSNMYAYITYVISLKNIAYEKCK